MALPSWEVALVEDWLGQWAMNLMLINVPTRRFGRAVRLPDVDVPAGTGDGRLKPAVSRSFMELLAERMETMPEAAKGLRRLTTYRQLPLLNSTAPQPGVLVR